MWLFGFLMGVAYWPGIYGAPFMPRWWVLAIGLPFVSSFDCRHLHPFVLACGVLSLTWAAATIFWSPHPYGGTLDWLFALLLSMVAIAGAERKDIQPVLVGLSVGVGLSCILAVADRLIGSRVTWPGGLFFNTEVLAELAAPLCVWALWRRKWKLAGVLFTALPVCGSRIAWFVFAVGLLYGWRPQNRRFKQAVLFASLMLGLTAVVILKISSSDQRLVLWATAFRSITFTGRGLGWWYAAHPFPFEEYAHSDALQSLVEIGAGAAPLFVAAVFIWIRNRSDTATRACFLAMMIETLVSFPLHLPANGFLLAVLAGSMARRGVIVRAARPDVGNDGRAPVRWLAAVAAAMDRGRGCRRRDVPARSTFT